MHNRLKVNESFCVRRVNIERKVYFHKRIRRTNTSINAKIAWNSEYFLQSFIDKYFLKNIGNIHQLAWPHTFLRIF